MANIIQCMIALLTFFTCQLLCGEARDIRYLTGIEIHHIKGPSHRGIRKLSTLIDNFYHSKKSASPKKISPEFSETILHKEKPLSSKPSHKSQGSNRKVGSFWVDINQSNCLGVNCPEDFKPTAPGKSPGAGHSFVTSTNEASPNQPTKTPIKKENNIAATADDFRETTPGQSPGAGHVKGVEEDFPPAPISFFSDSELISTNDFKPTAPGSSPGAGHPETKKIGLNCLIVKCTDDFRPTTPGDSPGAGHPTTGNSDMQSDVIHPQGGLDDYRPTKPGQSPGGGHAVFDKQEPNS